MPELQFMSTTITQDFADPVKVNARQMLDELPETCSGTVGTGFNPLTVKSPGFVFVGHLSVVPRSFLLFVFNTD